MIPEPPASGPDSRPAPAESRADQPTAPPAQLLPDPFASAPGALLDLPLAAVGIDAHAQVRFANDCALALLGGSAPEVVGQPWFGRFVPIDSPAATIVHACLQSGGAIPPLESEMVTCGGERRWISWHCALCRDAAGHILGAIQLGEDITVRRDHEARVRRTQRLESVRQLASGVAHDLNNILTPIVISADLLQADPRDQRDQDLVNTIALSARRAAEVVRQVLTFARGVASRRVLLETTPLLRALSEAAAQTLPSGVRFESHVAKDLWPVHGDAAQLRELLVNLCSNARDALTGDGSIVVTASNVTLERSLMTVDADLDPGRYVKLEVCDSGYGISPDIMDRIFEPFFTTKPVGKGRGLGLAIVLGIARTHGGGVTAQNLATGGASFSVYLPAVEEQAVRNRPTANNPAVDPMHACPPPAAADPDPVSVRAARAKLDAPHPIPECILVVDDDALTLEAAKTALEAEGFAVLSAEDGVAGLTAFLRFQGRIRAVLSDTMMPGLDGVEMIRAIRRLDPHVPIVSASGFTSQRKRAELESLRVSAFLPKPYTPELLQATLRSTVRQPGNLTPG